MSGWRVAGSLLVLRTEINALAPKRLKGSDGTIGDPRHAARKSEHNPNDAGIVCAHDFTHDPAHGADMRKFSAQLLARRHPALWYVIFDGRIASAKTGWKWARYTGSNPHRSHMHVSVRGSVDDRRPWGLTAAGASAPTPAGIKWGAYAKVRAGTRTVRVGSRGDDVRFLQRWLGLPDDGYYGRATETKVKAYQRMRALTVDGVVGPITWRNILG